MGLRAEVRVYGFLGSGFWERRCFLQVPFHMVPCGVPTMRSSRKAVSGVLYQAVGASFKPYMADDFDKFILWGTHT